MHIVAIHAISDPKTFWSAADVLDLPEGTTLHSAIPNEDGTRAICVWESDSVDTVRDFVDREQPQRPEQEQRGGSRVSGALRRRRIAAGQRLGESG